MKPSFEDMQLRLAMMASIPSLLVMLGVLCMSDLNSYLKWLIASLSTAFVSYCLFILHRRLNDQFVSLANLGEAFNIGDFSLRVKTTAGESGHSDLVHQLNRLADALTAARFDYKESQLLLAKLIKQIGVIIFACDDNNKLTLANPAAESAFGKTESK